jgi:probable F420-dependent oxidoreductase
MSERPFRFGVVAAQARSGAEWIVKAQRAEALGYATFLVPDTLGSTLSPIPALAAVAATTHTIRLGTYVLANDLRHPVLVAKECAALDWLSGGRFELGIGAGRPGFAEDLAQLGMPMPTAGVRVQRLSESLRIIKTLLSGNPAQSTSESYTIAAAGVFPRAIQQPHPPVLIAASGERMLALAGREADSVALAINPQEDANVFATKVAQLRQAAGDRFAQIEINVNTIAIGTEFPAWVTQRMGLDPQQLMHSSSLSVLLGTPDEMCTKLLERRARFGVSYITLSDAFIEAFAPVVASLAGI